MQQKLVFFFSPKSTTTCKRNHSDSDWQNPPVQLFAVFLILSLFHLISSLPAAWISDSVVVCVLLSTLGPLCLPFQQLLLSQFVSSNHSEPENLPRAPFLVWLNVLSLCSCSGDVLKQQVWFDCSQPSVHPLNFTKLKLPVQSLLSVCHFND